MANEIEYKLNLDKANRDLDQLLAKVERVQNVIAGGGSALSGGTPSYAIGGGRSSGGGVSTSATSYPPTSTTAASMAAPVLTPQQRAVIAQVPAGLSPNEYKQISAQLGVPASAFASMQTLATTASTPAPVLGLALGNPSGFAWGGGPVFPQMSAGMTGMARGAGAFAAIAGTGYLENSTRTALTGRPSIMGGAQSSGEMWGAGLGMLAMPFVGPGLGAAVMYGASRLGGAIFSRFAADNEARAQTAVSILPGGGSVAGFYGSAGSYMQSRTPFGDPSSTRPDTFMPASVIHSLRMQGWSDTLRAKTGKGYGVVGIDQELWNQFMPTQQDVASTYTGMVGSLIAGGINPEGRSGLMNPAPVAPPMPPNVKRLIEHWTRNPNPTRSSTMFPAEYYGKDGKAGEIPNVIAATIAKMMISGAARGFDSKEQQDEFTASLDRVENPALRKVLGEFAQFGGARRDYRRNFAAWRDMPGETISQMYTRRLTERYLRAAPETQNMVGPIFAGLPESGGNVADILMAHGAEKTSRFMELGVEKDQMPSMGIEELMGLSAGIRGTGRDLGFAGLQARGTGASTAGVLRARMDLIGKLPGGTGSMIYAQSRAGLRDATRAAFDQEGAAGYGIRRSNIDADRAISNTSPYAPGNRFGIELRGMAADRAEYSRLSKYMEGRRASGDLSEHEELELTGRMNSLRVSVAQSVGTLSEGVENRMPALSTLGGRASFRRFDSNQLAAVALWRAGSPVRGRGAMGGRQQHMQEDFVDGFGMGGMGGNSRSEGLNNPRMAAAMERLAAAIEKMNAGGGRGGGSNLPPAGGYTQSGGNAPFN
jgi:hypothetical protein